ncbi:Uma2 family endonuclease [Leptolyngbya sp. NK1-12]|uniref:Uma2 family endonuclease n=1 Tax=Leptolyngbya sp. NK1-12 TaxID=2547451 RepID=A0AA96WK70_9CYAN|nr:Uma2 family endonuclease [Leptolyngbya sp. NK1-12]WNZ26180.1 Uma2 family endonuclease [Leptolyngbya sp. NK1-12]
MTQAKPQFSTFQEYLSHSADLDNRYEWIDGELIELPPESEFNLSIANFLFLKLVNAGIPLRLVHPHACELQVPVLQPGDAANRYPDLVVLRQEHLPLTQRRLTITLEMPPPRLVVEVVSPGQSNRERDYNRKRAQYAKRNIPEYWLIDPERQVVIVLELINHQDDYQEMGRFQGNTPIISSIGTLNLTAMDIFKLA